MAFSVEVVAAKSASAEGIVEVSTSFLEEYFGVSRQTLTRWEQKGCPKLGYGTWDFIQVLKWRGGLTPIEESDDSSGSLVMRKLKAEAFLKEQQGEIAAIELDMLKKRLVEIDTVMDIIGGIILNTKGLLLALPSKAAPRLLGLSMLDDLKDILGEYAGRLIKAKTTKETEAIFDSILQDMAEAKSIVEINEVLSLLVHEALEELAGMTLERFGVADA